MKQNCEFLHLELEEPFKTNIIQQCWFLLVCQCFVKFADVVGHLCGVVVGAVGHRGNLLQPNAGEAS